MSTRYPLSNAREGYYYGTSNAKRGVKSMIDSGVVKVKIEALQEGERLDIVAFREYKDASLWWIIAAASGIGWGLQVPPGVRLVIPLNPGPILNAVG